MGRRRLLSLVAVTTALSLVPLSWAIVDDDTATLQAAIDAAARTGVPVVLGPGRYRTSRPLVFPEHAMLLARDVWIQSTAVPVFVVKEGSRAALVNVHIERGI